MKSTLSRRVLSAVGVAALVSASVLVGSTSAQAGNPLNECGVDFSIGTFADVQTAGAWWWGVCLNTTEIDEGETTNKTDAFDGFGQIFIDGYSDPVAAVPSSSGYVGANYVNQYIDAGFDLGGGDVVDIVVIQTFSGTFVRWEVSIYDTGTATLRTDVPFTISGNLGCDTNCIFLGAANQFVNAGDTSDPIILWQIDDATTYSFSYTDLDDEVDIHATGPAVLTLGLVDYACDSVGLSDSYAFDILSDGLGAHFGESLRVPGTEDCVTVGGPLQVAPGQAFDYVVPLTLPTPPWDWSAGGYGDISDAPDWVDFEGLTQNVDGTPPGFRIFGTAPSEPGTYLVPLYVGQNSDDTSSRGFLTIIVSAPALAATGVDVTATFGAGAVLTALGVLALLVTRRMRPRVS